MRKQLAVWQLGSCMRSAVLVLQLSVRGKGGEREARDLNAVERWNSLLGRLAYYHLM